MAKPLLGEQKAMHDLLKNEKASEGPASIAKEKEHNYSKPSSEVMHTMLTLWTDATRNLMPQQRSTKKKSTM